MLSAITSLFGSYSPLTATYYLWDEAQQTYIQVIQPIPGLAGVNWPWILGGALVIVGIVCCFKLLGVFLKGIFRI